jgi:hypothetical protein
VTPPGASHARPWTRMTDQPNQESPEESPHPTPCTPPTFRALAPTPRETFPLNPERPTKPTVWAAKLCLNQRTAGSSEGRARKSYGDDHAFWVVAVLFQVPGEANVAPATVALAWQLSRQSVTGPIVSARVPEQ